MPSARQWPREEEVPARTSAAELPAQALDWLLFWGQCSSQEFPVPDRKIDQTQQRQEKDSRHLCTRRLHWSFKGILYRKMNRNSIKGPLKAGGSGSNGVEARIEEIAARSSASLLELPTMAGSASGTTPLRMMRNCKTTFPRSPSRADSGITAYHLPCTLASTRAI